VTTRTARGLRAAGVGAIVLWSGIALTNRAAWPAAGLVALGVAAVVSLVTGPVLARLPDLLLWPPRRVFVGACAGVAAAVSWWVLASTLRDRPLSIDAGIYLLQAHALAHGHFGMAEPLPVQAFADRFLLEGPDQRLYGIFPPGWPLAIVPFVWLGRPMLVGPVVAAATIVAQAWLGRALARASGDESRGELAVRVSLLLSLTSIARALETADLLSHAFVGLLSCVAVAAALDATRRPALRGVVLGACVGWVASARLLDGVVLAAVVAVAFALARPGRAAFAWGALGAAPFLALLLVEQHAATGQWLMPTQTLYFARSDWPPTCHRLGFGPDIGCTVEHPGPVSRLGGNGFGLPQAVGVVRERAGSLGEELFGFAPLALVAFVSLLVWASAADAVAASFVLALTLAYGLFYYGNALFFGARHLYPTAPFFWLLAARGAVALPHREGRWLGLAHVQGAPVLTLLVVAAISARGPWKERLAAAAEFQSARSDLTRTMAIHAIDRGILKTRDYTAFASAFEPAAVDAGRVVALEDGSGLLELRRMHPDLPVFLSLAGDDVGRLYVGRPTPGVLVELERSWPALVRPDGVASRQLALEGASGGFVLLVSHARPGGEIAVPFDVALAGTYALRIDGRTGPDQGDYDLTLDGSPMPSWRGFSSEPLAARGAAAVRSLTTGRHTLVARCIGRNDASQGYDARLDSLVGTPAEGP
jgi:hypothetical protein